MKKLFIFALALSLLGLGGLTEVSYADVQIDEGQLKSTAPVKFFVGRYARTGAISTAGAYEISKDSVVVWDTTSADGVTIQSTTTADSGLVAGITMDLIPGSSRDNTAVLDDGYSNWGRIQTWGLHNDVRVLSAPALLAGESVCSSTTAQAGGPCSAVSADNVVAVALNTTSSSTVDVMVRAD